MKDDPKANSIEGFIEALVIFSKYEKKGLKEKFFLEAEHDIIYSHVGTEKLSKVSDEGKRLIDLGWHTESDTESWAYYT